MSNAKHTPGPWEIGDYDEELQAVRIRAGGFVPLTPAVALAAGLDKPRAYSNARLIAAAPDLLSELEKAHRIIGNALQVMSFGQKHEWAKLNAQDGVDGEGTTRANEREAAIAKAEGGAE